METFSRLGKALRFLRDRQGLSQKEVAQRADVTPPMLSAYENDRADPELPTLDRILRLGLAARLEDLAWALRVVNDRVAATDSGGERSRRALRAGILAAEDSHGSGVPERLELDEALEQACAQIAQGLTQISRVVLENVARDPAGPISNKRSSET